MSETMNIYAPRGAKVIFLNHNGYDHDLEHSVMFRDETLKGEENA